jgi:hypothetical protein
MVMLYVEKIQFVIHQVMSNPVIRFILLVKVHLPDPASAKFHFLRVTDAALPRSAIEMDW